MKKIVTEVFRKEKFKDFVLNEVLGRFIGFMVGMLTAKFFSHEVYEKKGLKNLFGLIKRKKIIVNTTPEWLQWIICALIGYITLELINYFFRNKLYIDVWEFFKKNYAGLTNQPYERKRENVVENTCEVQTAFNDNDNTWAETRN